MASVSTLTIHLLARVKHFHDWGTQNPFPGNARVDEADRRCVSCYAQRCFRAAAFSAYTQRHLALPVAKTLEKQTVLAKPGSIDQNSKGEMRGEWPAWVVDVSKAWV